ncbi:MAG: glycosyltransferase family 2 protein [Johnsonella sp.]|nr:glycosyltransferase family 2 protein [Johnsonella sp.]
MKNEISIIIPNFNGMKFLPECIESLRKQSVRNFDILVVDNASSDGSREWLQKNGICSLFLEENLGFAGGVNAGLSTVDTKYVILLNNDTIVFEDYVERLREAIELSENIFSVSSMMIQAKNRDLIDDAGDGFCILGWAYQIGVGERIEKYQKPRAVFSACAGAAIYRKSVLDEIGFFDEMHFAYLEDIDLGYRARLFGYENRYEPRARVYHLGSATSGSKYNSFKVRLSARNTIYLNYKNQSNIQLCFNALPLLCGVLIKALFFLKKGFFKDYLFGLKEGFSTCGRCKRADFKSLPIKRLLRLEWEMILGMFAYIGHFIGRRMSKKGKQSHIST